MHLSASIVASLLGVVALATPAPEGCKKLPIDPDWPLESVWNTELKGNEPHGPQKNWTAPDYTYEASRVTHVQTAVQFAAKYNVRISIINSGHDFIGRNDAPSGIKLTVGGLKGIRVLESFESSAKGAEPVHKGTKTNTIMPVPGKQAAVIIGGGINIDELNKALRSSGLYAIGAAHGEVSVAGGWVQAGGHAPLSSYYGLGVDQVLEYKVVTATGDLVVANSVTNQDLFWALRGGGPSTYGVVVEATVKAYPSPKMISYSFWLNTTDYDDTKSIFPAAAYMCSQLPRLNKENGVQGYFYIHRNAISANWIIPNEFTDADKVKAALDPVLNKMANMPGVNPKSLIKIPPTSLGATSLGAMQASDGGQAVNPSLMAAKGKGDMMGSHSHSKIMRRHGPGDMVAVSRGNVAMDSRLLGIDELTHPKLAEALHTAIGTLPNAQLRSHLVGGNAVLKENKDTSVLPAWRKAYVHMIAAAAAGEPDLQAIRDISPKMGAYINEAWIKNPNWKNDFWGNNYQRLSEIKTKWDPNFVFYVTPGINADQMVAKDGRLCKGIAAKTPGDTAPRGDNLNEGDHERPRTSFPLLFKGKGLPPKTSSMPKMGGPKSSNSSTTTTAPKSI